MTFIQILVLSLIQGLTEFLPVSSSAHLILGSKLFSWPDQGLVFDVATHLGTLLAVLFYFRKTVFELCVAWLRPAITHSQRESRSMAKYLVMASIPAILVGGLAHSWVELYLRDVRVIAVTTLVFGAVLWAADAFFAKNRSLENMKMKPALLIGLAQVLALIPGTSRSGITITMGRMLGFSPDAAARFSFLLAIPILSAAGGYGMLRVWTNDTALDWNQFFLAVALSAVAGWVCIAAFLALLKRYGLFPFVIYRLILGIVLLILTF
ncbi:MAG: undecaprenyl-diphosphatase [Lysobacterales bacterium]